jgi:ubiquinol-cytochrome c reductase iron-sulfur subunit
VAKARDFLLSGLVLLLGRGARRRRGEEASRLVPRRPVDPRAETAVLALLACSSLCAIGFVVVYAVDSIPRQTQFLGLSLGLALLFFAAALIVVGKSLVPEEELVDRYPVPEHPYEQELVASLADEASDGISRRRLLKLGLLGAGGALGLAAITPALSLGPLFEVKRFFATPWRRGRRLVDENGRPYRADDIEERTFYTAFPEGADREQQGAPVVLVRVAPGSLRLPAALEGYDAGGIVAYSKICTHAGCAISLYRVPKFAPTEPGPPALVCPCHYSTFDVLDGGSVVFGPAGRKLPMLPLSVDGKGYLRAQGNFDEAVGPSWWGVRNRRPTS